MKLKDFNSNKNRGTKLTQSLTITSNTTLLNIGGNSITSTWGNWDGDISEFRISISKRSEDWIFATYDTLKDNFITFD